jgi:predicted RecB family endonuclease
MTETFLASILCVLLLDGKTEEPHGYSVGYGLHKIRVDCETDTHVIEVGLDKRSSTDSVHQAVFAAHLTGKTPMVIMIDRDGRMDQYEFQVRTVAEALGVEYRVYDEAFLIRWQMTDYLRNYGAPERARRF